MKYMTFNSSCSYAGIANMLEIKGLNLEDYEVALGMELPYLIAKENNKYLAGPMLQSKKWFDIFLNKYDFELVEELVPKQDVIEVLLSKDCAMLGLRIDETHKHAVVYCSQKNDETHKHAVVYCSQKNDETHNHAVVCSSQKNKVMNFINNKHRESQEPETLEFTFEELLDRIDDEVMIGSLMRRDINSKADKSTDHISESITVLDNLKEDIIKFCNEIHSREEFLSTIDSMFRPILLDSISMLSLINEVQLVTDIKSIQQDYMKVVFTDKIDNVALKDYLDMSLFASVFDRWRKLMICHHTHDVV